MRSWKRPGKRWSVEVILAAACLFLLQSVVGGWAIASANASPRLDIFGNPLCITSSTAPDAGHDAPDHAALCLAACSTAAPAANVPPEQPLPAARADAAAVLAQPIPAERRVRLEGYEPQNPRAPPLTA